MNLNRIIGILGFSLLLGNLSAQSDSIMSFSLVEAQNYAIENYFLSVNAKKDIEIARKKILETTAIGLPQVTATSDYQFIPNAPSISIPMGPNPEDMISFSIAPEHTLKYGATVSQLIFSGEYIVGLQAAKVYRTFSEENYEKVKIDLRENVAGTYYGILVLQANREVLSKTLDNLKDNLSQIEKTYQAGLVEDTEVDQLSLTVKRTENDLTSIDNQIQYMQRLFKYLLGLTDQDEVVLTEKLEYLIQTNIISDSTYNFVLEENIEFNILQTAEDLQKLNMDRQKSTYLPTLAGFYAYSDQTEVSDFSPNINHVLGVSASWPILQSGQRAARVSQARIEYEKAQILKEQNSEGLRLTAEQAKFDYQTALRKYENEKLNFELSAKVLNKTNEKFKLGMVSSLEQSLINIQFLTAQISYAASIQELLTAKVALDKAYSKL
ncbi:MAG: TolC family protein [Bacteroidota bacterium]|nr:MAG: TolC family protein [Bacteroidota bacterium]